MDCQNIAIHEIGHLCGLADLYQPTDSEKTMYGYAATGETKKRTLDQDDIDGLVHLYYQDSAASTFLYPDIGEESYKNEPQIKY